MVIWDQWSFMTNQTNQKLHMANRDCDEGKALLSRVSILMICCYGKKQQCHLSYLRFFLDLKRVKLGKLLKNKFGK
jgi:hypothetical protein